MSDTLKRVLRTFVISFVALFVPATLGFLGEITKWAAARGEQPFPDLSVLGYAGVIAISAGLIAVLNLVVNLVEDATGKSLPGILSRPIKPAGAEVPTGMNKAAGARGRPDAAREAGTARAGRSGRTPTLVTPPTPVGPYLPWDRPGSVVCQARRDCARWVRLDRFSEGPGSVRDCSDGSSRSMMRALNAIALRASLARCTFCGSFQKCEMPLGCGKSRSSTHSPRRFTFTQRPNQSVLRSQPKALHTCLPQATMVREAGELAMISSARW
jgi:hypothetical protein